MNANPAQGRPRVVVTDYLDDDLAPEREVLEPYATVEALKARSEDELVGRIEDAAALLVYHYISLTSRTIDRLQRCRIIVRCGAGYDNIDWRRARERGIPVANVPDYGTEEVADSAIGMLLALTRGVSLANSLLRSGEGASWDHRVVVPLRRLRKRTLGIVGLGRIGTAVARRAVALGMDVVFFDPYKPSGYDKALGIRRAERLDELLGQSYVLSLHCPLTDETRGMIDRGAIATLPQGSYLINTARGAIVDPLAVVEALETGHLAGAAIDVLDVEPPPPEHPLVRAWRDPSHPAHHRLIINPHCAFYSEEAFREMRVKGAMHCLRALRGEPVRDIVN